MAKQDTLVMQEAPRQAQSLADNVRSEPHRLATGDAGVHSLAQDATKALFDQGT